VTWRKGERIVLVNAAPITLIQPVNHDTMTSKADTMPSSVLAAGTKNALLNAGV
jgi:hypothetical protein